MFLIKHIANGDIKQQSNTHYVTKSNIFFVLNNMRINYAFFCNQVYASFSDVIGACIP